jgi:hypothetical protein
VTVFALHRGTLHRTVGTKDAAVASFGAQQRLTASVNPRDSGESGNQGCNAIELSGDLHNIVMSCYFKIVNRCTNWA